ncbi:MAG TPA: PDZ domain-containing protein [Nocardioidaceae bacterium]|nr:PDZ domain-containing protein [Nocardioidaceae bacterium]
MTRRSVASVGVLVLLIVLVVVAGLVRVPYVVLSPGPTINVLKPTGAGSQILSVQGHKVYPDKGQLRLVTVRQTSPDTRVNIAIALFAWLDQTRALFPRDVVYPPDQSVKQVQRQSSVEMVSSQDTATAAALTELGYHYTLYTEVLGVGQGAPADGVLKVHDRIVAVNGVRIHDIRRVTKAVQKSGVGGKVHFTVRRNGRTRHLTVKTTAAPGHPKHAIVGITIGPGYTFPFDVQVKLADDIGGPSAGLIFSLGIYDRLTPGALTGGRTIAGTGTITAKGKVGPIGGIQQKIVAAADAGATLFLVPPANCKEALGADVPSDKIRLAKAPSMQSAIHTIKTYAAHPSAPLPSCS